MLSGKRETTDYVVARVRCGITRTNASKRYRVPVSSNRLREDDDRGLSLVRTHSFAISDCQDISL